MTDTYGAVKDLIKWCREDPEREGLRDTPKRVTRAFREWTSGYDIDPMSILTSFEDGGENYDMMIVEGLIPFQSTCEHHLCQFFGYACVGYLPRDGRIVGISKLTRLVDVFAKRLQVQERITTQVAHTLMSSGLNPLGVGVMLRCRHMCIESRGVKKHGAVTSTSALLGNFRSDAGVRQEFLSIVSHLDGGAVPL